MIEGLVSGFIRLVAWLWSSATTLYHLAGFFIVAGGFVIFLGTVIHTLWHRSVERVTVASAAQRRTVRLYVNNLNLTLEVTESQLHSLLAYRDLPALPEAKPDSEDDDRA